MLRLKFALGIFEAPYADLDAIELDRPEERALAREVAEKSIVLLANDGVLPLAASLRRVAVIGPNAADPMALYGNYSFQNHVAAHFPKHPIAPAATVLDALRERLGAGRVDYAEGCKILRAPGQLSDDRSGIAAAVACARRADVAVVVVGDKAGHFRTGTVGEGTDASDLTLPGVQSELVEAVLATGTPTVVVLVNGRAFDLSQIAGRAAAIVEAWFPGQDGGAAIAAVLAGDVVPSGKTTLGFSRGAGAQPRSYDHKPLARGVPPLPAFEPVFAFGHGLSYTRFEYEALSITPACTETDGSVTIAFTLRNAGERDGEEVVQLYLQRSGGERDAARAAAPRLRPRGARGGRRGANPISRPRGPVLVHRTRSRAHRRAGPHRRGGGCVERRPAASRRLRALGVRAPHRRGSGAGARPPCRAGVSRGVALLAVASREDLLAQPQRHRRHFEQLVVGDPAERGLDRVDARRCQHHRFVLAGRADVGELLGA